MLDYSAARRFALSSHVHSPFERRLSVASRSIEGAVQRMSQTRPILAFLQQVRLSACHSCSQLWLPVCSLEGSGLYIDSYGYKHDKSNENDRLQYICVKLTHFYDVKAHSTDESIWRALLKSYQNSSTVPVRRTSRSTMETRSVAESIQMPRSARNTASSPIGILACLHSQADAKSPQGERRLVLPEPVPSPAELRRTSVRVRAEPHRTLVCL